MGIHLLAVAKLKLLAASAAAANGHAYTSPVAVLVWPFALKLPLHGRLSKLYADFAASSVLFLFRLSQIVFQQQPQHHGGRWERALRLFRERVTSTTYRASTARFESVEASFHQASMLAL
ncbi:hypothetical protein H6P81_005229 [Aristolochia fimbriata]|uniref:Secreted protein n=1 Tax=Aristolochia fimbriata TaxID=158543 RepID=A0AAV7ETU9_ARIFI|nr:hypothetical protein H6P81_005229 [Aristolochia fimbriata]